MTRDAWVATVYCIITIGSLLSFMFRSTFGSLGVNSVVTAFFASMGLGVAFCVLMLCYGLATRITKTGKTSRIAKPPLNASFLLIFFFEAAMIGDLEQRHGVISKKFGKGRADFWFWTQAIISVAPIVWMKTKSIVKALTGLATLVELYQKYRGIR